MFVRPGRDAAARDDPRAGRLGGGVPVKLLERLRVVGPEVDQVDAGRDGRIGDPDVVAHVGRIEDDLGLGEGGRQRRRILDIHADDAVGRAEPFEGAPTPRLFGGRRW